MNIEVAPLESAEFRRNMTSFHDDDVCICRTCACMFQLLHIVPRVLHDSRRPNVFSIQFKGNNPSFLFD